MHSGLNPVPRGIALEDAPHHGSLSRVDSALEPDAARTAQAVDVGALEVPNWNRSGAGAKPSLNGEPKAPHR